jgi:hypothetical protein
VTNVDVEVSLLYVGYENSLNVKRVRLGRYRLEDVTSHLTVDFQPPLLPLQTKMNRQHPRPPLRFRLFVESLQPANQSRTRCWNSNVFVESKPIGQHEPKRFYPNGVRRACYDAPFQQGIDHGLVMPFVHHPS